MNIFRFLDLALTLGALDAADWLRHSLPPAPVARFGWQVYLAAAIIWLIAFRLFPLYNSKRADTLFDELLTVGGAVIFSWVVFAAWTVIFDYADFSRFVLVAFVILDLAVLLIFHLCLRLFLRFLRSRGYNLKQVLIVGAGAVGQQVARALLDHPWAGFIVVGFLDDNPTLHGVDILSIPVLGDLDQTHAIAKTLQVDDEIIIALPPSAYGRLVEVIQAIDDIPVNVRVVPDLFGIASIRPTVEELWDIPLIGIRQPMITGLSAVVKRALDILGAAFGLFIFAPAMLAAALLIKLDSKGSVLFIQERAGENGKPFKMYKFRTMAQNAEAMLDHLIDLDELAEPVFKLKNDPRVTRSGRWLRRTSIDETPQLFNVLKGDMSLVGPRPEETRLVRRYTRWHRKRLMAKPGLTGPVQVSGRGDLCLEERVRLEVDYIYNYSLWQDIKILFKTVPTVIRGKGSY